MTPAFNTGVAIQEALGSSCETEAWFLRLDVSKRFKVCNRFVVDYHDYQTNCINITRFVKE
jgi:hypothetical protein